MEPDRFDDDAVPEDAGPPPPPPRRRRWALAMLATVLAAGGITAGASALTGSGDEGGRLPAAASEPRPHVTYTSDRVPFVRAGPECRAGASGRHHGKRERDAALMKH